MRALKQALHHGLILKIVHRVIQFNLEAWCKPNIAMNTKLRKESKLLKLLLNTQMICKMFIKILKNTVLERNAKH